MNPDEIENAIAIIGMSGRFPGADDIHQFWHNLCQGIESISFFSPDELEKTNSFKKTHNYVNARGILNNIEYFDADFFGINPQEAQIIDPQHRLFLECSWEALEDAGYNLDLYHGRVGVYGGTGMSTYFLNNLYHNQRLKEKLGDYMLHIGNDKDFLTTRVSYKMNLKGPSLNIQTACSTSLVSICIACNHLQSYQCDMALAGAASITVPQKAGYPYQEGMIFSPDGHCKPFDADAKGTVPGNGVGIIVLKRLEDAVADRDHVYAIIRGYGTNNDGYRKMGYAAPSVQGQTEAINSAIEMAGINPETITYVEAHGTGTYLGDPIEIEALSQAFQTFTQKKAYCALSSVKGNIGHLMESAGIAGLIKTVMALQHHLLPPTLHFKNPNPHIDFINSPFYINTTLSDWKSNKALRACISSFGIGGTNAHVILEESTNLISSSFSRESQLILLSAKSQSALKIMADNLAHYLLNHQSIPLVDVAYTLQIGRKTFEHRQMFVSSNSNDAALLLLNFNSDTCVSSDSQSKIVFLLEDQGVEYLHMGFELYESEPCFRNWIDKCAILLRPYLGVDIREVLYPTAKNIKTSSEHLLQDNISTAAMFITEYATAKLWEEWGILPQEIIGYGLGEYVAACLAGVFSLENAFQLLFDKNFFEKVKLSLPKIPFISNLTGTWIISEQALSHDYWSQRYQKMNFPNDLEKETNSMIFIEISPGTKLCDAVRCYLSPNAIKLTLSSLPDATLKRKDTEVLLTSLGHLWCVGLTVDWVGFYKYEERNRVHLPTYPFEKKRFWVDPPALTEQSIVLHPINEHQQTSIEDSLVSIWKEYLGHKSLDLHDDFFLLGGDSLLAIQVISKIQTTFGITLKAHTLLEFPTIAQLTTLISQRTATLSKDREQPFPPAIVKLKEDGDRKPFFLIHPIGGQVFCYKPLVACIKYEGSIYGVQADYADSKKFKNMNSIEAMASYYLHAMRQVQPEGPYQLLGYSFGGLIAYEIANQLQESGHTVNTLTMVDTICPNYLSLKRIKKDCDMINLLIELFEGKPLSKGNSIRQSPKKQLERLMRSMKLHMMPLIEQKKIFELTKLYCHAMIHYHPKPYQGKIIFLQAKDRFFRMNEISLDVIWKDLCNGEVVSHDISGNHSNMLMLPQVKEITSFLELNLN